MKRLYVIGNGFDLHHEIPSGYKNYRDWLELNNPDVLNTIDNLFGYCNSNWWKHFEESLASVETLRIAVEKTAENSTIERDSDWYVAEHEVGRMIDEAYEDIKSSFYEWINSLPQGEITKMIDIDENDSVFLSFNYTLTLEDLYNISSDKIFHIHGDVNSEELVLGHGKKIEDLKKMVEGYNNIYDDSTEAFILERTIDSATYSVSKYRKKVEDIINKNSNWFMALGNVSHIYIYGLSFADVDLPYLKKILSVVDKDSVQIEISYLTEEDKVNINDFMESESIPKSNYNIVELNQHLLKGV